MRNQFNYCTWPDTLNQKSINKLSWLVYFWFSYIKYLPIDTVCVDR